MKSIEMITCKVLEVLNHSLDASERSVPMGRPIHSPGLSREVSYYLREGQNLNLHDPVYDNPEFSNSYFLSPVREPSGS